jgi:hypothetical protein
MSREPTHMDKRPFPSAATQQMGATAVQAVFLCKRASKNFWPPNSHPTVDDNFMFIPSGGEARCMHTMGDWSYVSGGKSSHWLAGGVCGCDAKGIYHGGQRNLYACGHCDARHLFDEARTSWGY